MDCHVKARMRHFTQKYCRARQESTPSRNLLVQIGESAAAPPDQAARDTAKSARPSSAVSHSLAGKTASADLARSA